LERQLLAYPSKPDDCADGFAMGQSLVFAPAVKAAVARPKTRGEEFVAGLFQDSREDAAVSPLRAR
jgi:hypothetical protein